MTVISKVNKKVGSYIFQELKDDDRVSLIKLSSRVNMIYSFSEKSKNTTQLRNQITCLEPANSKRLVLVKGLIEAVKKFRK